MFTQYRKLLVAVSMVVLCILLIMNREIMANVIPIDFTTFLDGIPLPDEAVIFDQFEPLGVRCRIPQVSCKGDHHRERMWAGTVRPYLWGQIVHLKPPRR
jgi:hypothetical protein